MVVVLMGVSGAGKTTVGERLADALGGTFAEGDAYHPPANVEKMRGGTPLDDEDRWPWLQILSAEIDRWLAEGRHVVLACSALKERYRQILHGGRAGVRFVHLAGDAALIGTRLEGRRGHYMPPTLLQSQLAALEPPDDAITIDVDAHPETLVERILDALAHHDGRRPTPREG
jgi:gluconokinase